MEPPRDPKPDIPQPEIASSDVTSKKRKRKASKQEQFFPERSWDPESLPVYSDAILQSNQKTVEDKMDYVWGKLEGTNGEPVFSKLTSIVYPWTFPPDVMHLVDENIPRLFLAHWMGAVLLKQNSPAETQPKGRKPKQKGKKKTRKEKANKNGTTATTATPFSETMGPTPTEPYILSTKTWGLIGNEISKSRKLFPTAFGKALRDISKYHASYKASELLNFMYLISPIVLNGRLPEAEYSHWHHLVLATERTRQFTLSEEEITEMGEDMVQAVTEYERLYYQYKRGRLSSCTSQVHGVLHLSAAIRLCGPNPTYHQYPTERMCGFIKSMTHSRSAPNRNLSIGILEAERLKYLPYVALIPEGLKPSNPQDTELENAAGTRIFELPEQDMH